jgi:hypothetical protein
MVRRCGVWLKAGGQQCCVAVHGQLAAGCGRLRNLYRGKWAPNDCARAQFYLSRRERIGDPLIIF